MRTARSSWSSTAKACTAPAAGKARRHMSPFMGRGALVDALSAALLESARAQAVIFRFHDDDAVTALFLGAVQGFIGELDQASQGAAVARQHERGPDADR